MSHHHPGYSYRLTGRIKDDTVAITPWGSRSEAEERLAAELANDRVEGHPTEGVYKIEKISNDWLA